MKNRWDIHWNFSIWKSDDGPLGVSRMATKRVYDESEASTCGPDTRFVSALRCPIWIGCVQANVIKIEGQ